MYRAGSFQRVLNAINSIRRGRNGSTDADEEEGGSSQISLASGPSMHDPIHSSMGTSSSGLPVCLICLEPLTPDDFESGEAMSLECECKGDMGLRHRSCAVKWVNVKGDLICDICHTPIGNLPAPPPRSDNADDALDDAANGRYVGATDVFDCIRMTWVVTIVCILFFEFNITRALLTGVVVALLYTFSCQFMRCMYTRTDDVAGQRGATQNGNPANPANPAPAPIAV